VKEAKESPKSDIACSVAVDVAVAVEKLETLRVGLHLANRQTSPKPLRLAF